MRLVFIDETGDTNHPNYLGFSIATVDSRFYPTIKRATHAILKKAKWDPKIEFKGSYLFSESKGCAAVGVEDRVHAAGELLDLNASKVNSRLHFAYGRLNSENVAQDYLEKLPSLLSAVLPRANTGPGKNLISITCDERSDVPLDKLHNALAPAVLEKGYVILESVTAAKSSIETVGLMFADIVGYLYSRVDTIKVDAEIFHEIPHEVIQKNGQLRKLASSKELIKKIRDLTVLTHKTAPPRIVSNPIGSRLVAPASAVSK